MKKWFIIWLLVCAVPVHADTIFFDVTDRVITDNTIFTPDNIYVIQGNIAVPAGVTLTIEPGTVVKFKNSLSGVNSGRLVVNGDLVAEGTADSPIVLTAYNDDAFAGDTNGDGTATVAFDGDWAGLQFASSSTGNLQYVQIVYGGYNGVAGSAGLTNDGGNVSASNVSIDHASVAAVFQGAGTTSIDNSTIDGGIFGIEFEGGNLSLSHSAVANATQYGLNAIGGNSLSLIGNTFSNNAKTAKLAASIPFTHADNSASDIDARGFTIFGPVADGVHLYSDDLPLIISGGDLDVSASTTATIDPGTVIKFGNSGSIDVSGTLNASGATDAPIRLTSIKNDAVSGDTNGDGEATVAAPGDWQSVICEPGAQCLFRDTHVSYGGNSSALPGVYPTFLNRGGMLALSGVYVSKSLDHGLYQSDGLSNIEASEFAFQPIAIMSAGGSVTVSGSSFHDQVDLGAYSLSENDPIQAVNNWWGDPSGPKDIGTSTPTGTGNHVFGAVSYSPWLTADPFVLSTSTATSTDEGSTGGGTSSSTPPVASSTPSVLLGTSTPVIIVPGILGSEEHDGTWVLDPILHAYDNLIDTLELNGYTEGVNLFTFPYDWRLSNVTTAGLLKQKIDAVKALCGCSKVNVIAHSMGGLAAQYYAESEDYEDDINELIFLGTPHRGAPEDYLAWEGGELMPDPIGFVEKIFLSQQAKEAGYLDLFSYIEDFPINSLRDLLPIDDYLKTGPDNQLATYPTGYPTNRFLEAISAGTDDLLHSDIRIRNYVGNVGTSTVEFIRVAPTTEPGKWLDGFPQGFESFFGDHGLEEGEGDGTVPLASASLSTDVDTVVRSDHLDLPSTAEAQIYTDLTGSTTVATVNRGKVSRLLIIEVLSPADIEVVAPGGEKVGLDPSTGEEVSEMGGAFYSGAHNGQEYVTIPNPADGAYRVNALGKAGGGEYTIVTTTVSDQSADSSQYSATIGPGEQASLGFSLDGGEPSPIVPVVAPDLERISGSRLALARGGRHLSQAATLASSSTPVAAVAEVPVPVRSAVLPRGSTTMPEAAGEEPARGANSAAVYESLSTRLNRSLHAAGHWVAGMLKRLFGRSNQNQ